MENSLEGLNYRFELEEERISELDDRSLEIIQSEELQKKNKDREYVASRPALKNSKGIL